MTHPRDAYCHERRPGAAARAPSLGRLMLQGANLRTALAVSLLIGSVLNLINYGGPLVAHQAVDWSHVILNFCVPFLVSSYSASRNQVRRPAES